MSKENLPSAYQNSESPSKGEMKERQAEWREYRDSEQSSSYREPNKSERKDLRKVLIGIGATLSTAALATAPGEGEGKTLDFDEIETTLANDVETPDSSDATNNEDESSYIQRINLEEIRETAGEVVEKVKEIFEDSQEMSEAEIRALSPNFYEEISQIAGKVSEQRLQIGMYNASKPVIGAEEQSREEYLQQEISFAHPDSGKEIPQALQDELRKHIVAQIFRESMFDNSSLNKRTGAFGTPQAMEKTAKDEGYDPEELRLSFKLQVEFVGAYYARMHGWLNHHINEDAMKYLKKGLTDEEFERDVMAPLLISSYHAGVGTLSTAVNDFYEANRSTALEGGGKDRFLDVIDFAYESKSGPLKNYDQYSREYVPKIYGEADAIAQYKQTTENTRLAYNDF